jgi:hypothetical protein
LVVRVVVWRSVVSGVVVAEPVGVAVEGEDDGAEELVEEAGTVVSPRMSPQEPTPSLLVRMVEVLRYCWETTWNSAGAASAR